MRVAVAAPFQTIAIVIALYGAFIFRESWIQFICLSQNTSLHSTHRDGANFSSTVPGESIEVSSLRQSEGKTRAGSIRSKDKRDAVIPSTDQHDDAGGANSGGAQSRINSTDRNPAPLMTNKANDSISFNATESTKTLAGEQANKELPPLRICRDSVVSLNGAAALVIPFQCQGPTYNDFILKLSKYMDDSNLHKATWGRREVPFPANSSILFLGNHHLGQTVSSLLCQYKDEIKTLTSQTSKEEGYTLEFKNGAVVEALINSHVLYSKNWKDKLERQLNKSLHSFDALILGNHNHVNDFLSDMLDKKAFQDGDDAFDFSEPPMLEQVASVYSGVIIAVSSFSNRKQALRESKKMRMDKAHLVEQGRTNIRFINGRKFVKMLDIEGASIRRLERKDAGTDGSGHRCSGADGGYPDLMAWEVIEKANELMEIEERNGSFSDGKGKTQTLNDDSQPDSAVVANENNDNSHDENDALLPLRVCEDPMIATDPDDPLIISYQCQGPHYEAFSQQLTDYMTNTSIHSSTWGRRPFPFPANKSVFIFGNSHTRQTTISILCQYQDQLKVLKPRLSGAEGFTAEFKNGAIAECLINNYALYGHNWKDLIEDEIGKPLASFDAILLGKFNRLKDSQNSTFMKRMEEISKTNPDVDFLHTRPPGLKQVAAVYDGNIVAFGMFSDKIKAEQEARIMAQDEAELHKNGRTNVRYIYGRKFVDILGVEGGSMNRMGVGDSHEVTTAHRCNGAHGGHPDLMAWEVIEKANELMENEDRNGSFSDGKAKTQALNDDSQPDSSIVVVNEKSNNIEDENDALLPLRICQDPTIDTDPDDPLIMNYQCQGPKYEAFSQQLTDYMTNTSIHSSTWGRRPFPFPANKSVFIFGNSHTRQTAISILCQYQDQLKVLKPRKSGDEGFTAEFKNGAVAECLINNYALYGHNWKDLIEDEIDKPLASFDAILLGKFNHLKDSQNSTFMKQMEEISKTNPDVDFFNIRPPGLKQVAAVYDGNIVAFGMFSDKIKAEQEARIMARDEAELHKNGRMNVRYIYGRKFVDILGVEGGSMNRMGVGDSHEVTTAHRCNGVHGGHPDLMSWEVLENLYDLFSLDGK